MGLKKSNVEKIEQLEKQIAELPVGYISKKNIRGKTCYYRQWKEEGKVKSEYINPKDVDYLIWQIDERRRLQEELRLEMLRGDESEKGISRFIEYSRRFYLKNKVGIGHQDYEELIKDKLFYVDKTRFISDWWETNDKVTLITRPRRFGKTLNLSMVNCFFSKKYSGRADLFKDFEVWRNPKMRGLQGTKHVICISLDGVKESDAEGQLMALRALVWNAFLHDEMIMEKLSEEDKIIYKNFLDITNYTEDMILNGVNMLCTFYYRAYGEKSIILIDEYDALVREAWIAGTWSECADNLRLFFLKTLTTNFHMERALLTGITCISQEPFFSDLINMVVYSMKSNKYAEAFGFTEAEVFDAMDKHGLTNKAEVKTWYYGFAIGNRTDIYNPWCIVNYLRDHEFRPFLTNASLNKMINDVLRRGDKNLKCALEDLINGKSIVTQLNEEASFEHIYGDNVELWSLLNASGYLKISDKKGESWEREYVLSVTNKEVYNMLLQFIRDWFKDSDGEYNGFIDSMLSNDVDYMTEYLDRICKNTFSDYDVSGREPERFYHGFVLGMLVDLKDRYIISSNRESGLGRYDVVLEPRTDVNLPAIIMEFKIHRPRKEKDMEETVQNALNQIEEKGYADDLKVRGFTDEQIYKYGIAFDGKKVWVG